VNLDDPTLRMAGTRWRTSATLARYVRNEYGDDDPTWLLSQIRAPTHGARSFSLSHRRPHSALTAVRRVARAFASILL